VKKTNHVKRKSRTHFEQVSLAIVKKVTGADASRAETAGPSRVILEPASRKTEPYSLPVRLVPRTVDV
jgi:hypothetical protein